MGSRVCPLWVLRGLLPCRHSHCHLGLIEEIRFLTKISTQSSYTFMLTKNCIANGHINSTIILFIYFVWGPYLAAFVYYYQIRSETCFLHCLWDHMVQGLNLGPCAKHIQERGWLIMKRIMITIHIYYMLGNSQIFYELYIYCVNENSRVEATRLFFSSAQRPYSAGNETSALLLSSPEP